MESTNGLHCLELELQGQVQGVGMRPALYLAAQSYALVGTISNTGSGTYAKLYGSQKKLIEFGEKYHTFLPKLAHITNEKKTFSKGNDAPSTLTFVNLESDLQKYSIPTDLATCESCWNEFFNTDDRRSGYPFITCCECGPRWSIMKNLPFERESTTMDDFPMCGSCKNEYENPLDRRFFAQTISCPDCGPTVSLSFSDVQNYLNQGAVGLVKGLGGFAIVGNARDPEVIRRIRAIKSRPEKPLAVMLKNNSALSKLGIDCDEWNKFHSSVCPIHLIEPKTDYLPHSLLTPTTKKIGVMAPTTPFHFLLFGELDALIYTSGNRKGDPIEYELSDLDQDFLSSFDFVLDHNRKITQPVDDSVISQNDTYLRDGRGLSPKVFLSPRTCNQTLLAFGADMKSSLALYHKDQIFLTPYLGSLSTSKSVERVEQQINEIEKLFKVKINQVISDSHPNYLSSYLASLWGQPFQVQHHLAHAEASLFESGFNEALIFVCDGTGYGNDGSIWGGEVFHSNSNLTKHIARFENFSILPGEDSFKDPNILLQTLLEQPQHSVFTNSIGRWFDAMTALCFPDRFNELSFEAQAPLFLEEHASEIIYECSAYSIENCNIESHEYCAF
ncbi:MAG: carbamoyltransferase HypF [Deltaproteobacteria bacterium]|nr:MAG: carbamoyltransferase HypF [Deltaproteobacteria bacterium]